MRVLGLGRWSLWYDETVSVYLARLPLRAMFAHTAGDIHPPGYYALLHLWQALTQPAAAHGLEFLYAWVSVACGMLLVALLYPLGVRTVGPRAALMGLWLAAINPFQLWYAQEVRMYTLGGMLALLALYAMLRWFDAAHSNGGWGWLALYALDVAAGLWSLYYFVFVLVGLGVASLILARSWRRWLAWLAANGVALLLFAPWLPIFWRQATDPPVPPWRVAWESFGEVARALGEALTALVAGQSAWGSQWVWALLAGVILLLFVVKLLASPQPLPLPTGEEGTAPQPRPLSMGEEGAPPLSSGEGPGVRSCWALLAFLLAPLAALIVVTLLVTPLYHVRYTFLFASVFTLIAGAVVEWVWGRDRIAGGVIAALLLAASLTSIWNLRSDPTFARDDHRGAVATLLRAWRPGDVVLVNAGWAYTPLEVYWRTDAEANEALPPPLAEPLRLGDPTGSAGEALNVLIVRTGSVDGAESLGWGAPDADFFALPAESTIAGLEALRENYARIWHYRIYDTVSDPNGTIRAWLDANTRLLRDEAIPGRDFGRLELREFLPADAEPLALLPEPVRFANAATLLGADVQGMTNSGRAHPAGTMLYATLALSPTVEWLASAQPLATSLRLYDGADNQVAQQDLTLPLVQEWEGALRAPLAVGIPADLVPGDYTLDFILYTANDGVPLLTEQGDRLTLASITVGAK